MEIVGFEGFGAKYLPDCGDAYTTQLYFDGNVYSSPAQVEAILNQVVHIRREQTKYFENHFYETISLITHFIEVH